MWRNSSKSTYTSNEKDKNYSAFVSRNEHLTIDNQLTLYQMQKIFESIGGELKNLTADQEENFANQIEQFIESLPTEQQEKIKDKLNIDAVTSATIKTHCDTRQCCIVGCYCGDSRICGVHNFNVVNCWDS